MRFNKLIPELSVADLDKSLNFYTKILPFKVDYSRDNFVFLSYNGAQIMLQTLKTNNFQTEKPTYPFGRGINFQIEVKDVEVILSSLKTYPVHTPLQENKYKVKGKMIVCKEFLVMDPDGYLLRFSESKGLYT